jgi:hypothetical protein
MNSTTNPETSQPTSRQEFEQSDRNPQVNSFGGIDNGGQIGVPTASESRVTRPGAVPSSSAGMGDEAE